MYLLSLKFKVNLLNYCRCRSVGRSVGLRKKCDFPNYRTKISRISARREKIKVKSLENPLTSSPQNQTPRFARNCAPCTDPDLRMTLAPLSHLSLIMFEIVHPCSFLSCHAAAALVGSLVESRVSFHIRPKIKRFPDIRPKSIFFLTSDLSSIQFLTSDLSQFFS